MPLIPDVSVAAARVLPDERSEYCDQVLAQVALRAGMDIRSVQEALGHASVATTQIYTHVNPKRLQQDWRRYHPAALPSDERETDGRRGET